MTHPAAGKSLEAEIAAAFRAGRSAAHGGQLSSTNPHDARSALASERLAAKMWLRGYSAGNPMPDPEDPQPSSEGSVPEE